MTGEAPKATLDTAKEGQRLKRAAQILLSAQMSRLDPNMKDDNERYGEEEQRSDDGSDGGGEGNSATRPKGEEGDLDDDVVLFCDGGCMPTAKFASWARDAFPTSVSSVLNVSFAMTATR